MRPVWTGSIGFGLVNIPVKMYPATRSSTLDLDMLDSKDLSNISFVRVNEKTGREVKWEEIVKGYKLPNDDYVVLTDKDFEQAAAKKDKLIEITEFTDPGEIDPIYYESPYYLAPDKNGERAYALFREALLKTGKVGIALFVMRSKETLAILKARQDVIDYYLSIADYIMPYLKGRPQSLKRNPDGIKDEGFFHKDAGDEAPEWVESIKIFSESADKNIDYILCNNKATLTFNNLGCIEINPWHSTTKALDYPDYLVIDVDPLEKNTFEQVVETANMIKEILDKTGAESHCKTSGATGLHVYVPLGKKYTYEQVKDFAKLICILAQEQLPKFTTLAKSEKKREETYLLGLHAKPQRTNYYGTIQPKAPSRRAGIHAFEVARDEKRPETVRF